MYDDNYKENIELAYTYTENHLKERKNDINNIKLRQGTFLGFAGLLLRFSLELPDNQPSYLLTKIGALVTSFCSIFILGLALRAYFRGIVYDPINLIKEDILESQNIEVKLVIIRKNTIACDDLYLLGVELKKSLQQGIIILVCSAFFFTLNGVLVSFFGK